MNGLQKKRIVSHNNIMLISVFIFILILSITIHSQIANAREGNSYTKSFTTIEISAGDTLSSIAATYGKPGQELQPYIEEVISINNLTDDTIHAGCYLVVPVYHKTDKVF